MLFKRILLKLSGESLASEKGYGIEIPNLMHYVEEVIDALSMGIEVSIVIGGGNIFRGLKGEGIGFDRVKSDQMGMLATIINSMAIQSALESKNVKAEVFSAINMPPVARFYDKKEVINLLSKGVVCILAGGTGNPYFTTDTAAALRAIEINAGVLLKGTRVDGIYSDDPEKNPQAVKYDRISFSDAYKQNLKIMDLTAFTLCQENKMPIVVFDVTKKGNLKRLLNGEKIGTLVYVD